MTLLDHHGLPDASWNGSCWAYFKGTLSNKDPSGSLHGPYWSIFLHRPLDKGKIKICGLVWGQSAIRFQKKGLFDSWWANCPPPLLWGLSGIFSIYILDIVINKYTIWRLAILNICPSNFLSQFPNKSIL